MTFKERAQNLKIQIPCVFMCLKDKRTPALPKVLAFIAVAYALSPVDLIPDFIPVIGYLDDLLILPVLVAWIIKLIPGEIWNENLQKAGEIWKDGKPKKWYYAIPIILVWLLLLFVLGKILWNNVKVKK